MVKDRALMKVYLLKILAYTLPYHAVASFLLFMAGSDMRACLCAFVLVVPAVLCLLARLKLRNYVLFTLSHIGIVALSLLCGTAATEKIVYVAVVFVMCGDSFRIVFGKKEEWEHRTSRMCVVVFAAGYAAAYAFGYHALLPLYIWELVAFLTLYFLVQGSFRTWHFVTNSKDTANMPVGQIRHVSTLLLFTFGLLSIGVMLLMAQIPIDLPWAELENALRVVVAGIFTVVSWIYAPIANLQNGGSGQTQSSAYSVEPWAQAGDPSALGQLLEHVFYIVFLALAIAAVIFALGFVFYRLQRRFTEKSRLESDVIESINADVVENRIGRIGSGFRRIFTPESNEQKARRAYKKYVNRRRGKGVDIPPAATPAEISAQIGALGELGDAQIRTVYEKARYSDDSVSSDDLLAMKRAKNGKRK